MNLNAPEPITPEQQAHVARIQRPNTAAALDQLKRQMDELRPTQPAIFLSLWALIWQLVHAYHNEEGGQ